MMKFACPNGHPLSAPEHLAGKPGKCPRCNTPFVVPPIEEVATMNVAEMAIGDPSASTMNGIKSAMGGAKNASERGEVFVFLCPNGHRLNGPPSLKGKAGQCPHCGARFLIPTDEEIEEQNEGSPGSEEEQADSGTDRGIDFNRLLGADVAGAGEVIAGANGVPPAGPAGLGYIVGRLWDQRTEESELEVFLNEGEIVAPDYYSELLSTSDYGVFAVQDGDGSFTVTTIPWNAVRRVGMRRLPDLPGDLFR
jgi:hypothetical protein